MDITICLGLMVLSSLITGYLCLKDIERIKVTAKRPYNTDKRLVVYVAVARVLMKDRAMFDAFNDKHTKDVLRFLSNYYFNGSDLLG